MSAPTSLWRFGKAREESQVEANPLPIPPAPFRAFLWPAGSARSRAARSLGVTLVLALSICSQTVAIVNYSGTNDYYGMVA
jgi:hypothetical protein